MLRALLFYVLTLSIFVNLLCAEGSDHAVNASCKVKSDYNPTLFNEKVSKRLKQLADIYTSDDKDEIGKNAIKAAQICNDIICLCNEQLKLIDKEMKMTSDYITKGVLDIERRVISRINSHLIWDPFGEILQSKLQDCLDACPDDLLIAFLGLDNHDDLNLDEYEGDTLIQILRKVRLPFGCSISNQKDLSQLTALELSKIENLRYLSVFCNNFDSINTLKIDKFKGLFRIKLDNPDASIIKQLKNMPSLRVCMLFSLEDIDLSVLNGTNSLQILLIKNALITKDNFEKLNSLSNLHTLILDTFYDTQIGLSNLKHFTKLRTLELYECEFKPRLLAKNNFCKNVSLTTLKIQGCPDLIKDLAFISGMNHLENLILSGYGVDSIRFMTSDTNEMATTDGKICIRIESLEDLAGLKYLKLEYCNISNKHLQHFQLLSKLDSLSVSVCSIENCDLSILNGKLWKLISFSCTKISTKQFKQLQSVKRLNYLTIEECDLSYKFIEHYFEMNNKCCVVFDRVIILFNGKKYKAIERFLD